MVVIPTKVGIQCRAKYGFIYFSWIPPYRGTGQAQSQARNDE
jgi:hypothetical protein